MVGFEEYNFVNLVGGGIAIGAVAVLSAGLIGYILSKFINLMIGRV